MKEDDKTIYKPEKLRTKTKDLNYIKCIKGEDERTLVKAEKIKEQ